MVRQPPEFKKGDRVIFTSEYGDPSVKWYAARGAIGTVLDVTPNGLTDGFMIHVLLDDGRRTVTYERRVEHYREEKPMLTLGDPAPPAEDVEMPYGEKLIARAEKLLSKRTTTAADVLAYAKFLWDTDLT